MHPLHLLSTLFGECLVHRYRKCQVTLLTQMISSPGTPYSLYWSTSLSFLVCLLSLPHTLIHHTYAATKMFYVLLQTIIPHANNLPNLVKPVRTCAKQSHASVCFPVGFCPLQDETTKKGMFGFPIDNTIGGTSQPNGWMDNWVDFYRERRLQHQLKLTRDPKLQQMGKKLCDNLEHFFQGIDVSCFRPLQQHSAHYAAVLAGSTTCICCKTVCTSTSSLTCLELRPWKAYFR